GIEQVMLSLREGAVVLETRRDRPELQFGHHSRLERERKPDVGVGGEEEAGVLPGEDGPDLAAPAFVRDPRNFAIEPEAEVVMPAGGRDELGAQLHPLIAAVGGLEVAAQLPEGQDAERRFQGDVQGPAAGPVDVNFEAGLALVVGPSVVDLDLERIERERRRSGEEYQERGPHRSRSRYGRAESAAGGEPVADGLAGAEGPRAQLVGRHRLDAGDL